MTEQNTKRQHPLDLLMVEDSAIDVELETDALRGVGLAVDVRWVEDEPSLYGLYKVPTTAGWKTAHALA